MILKDAFGVFLNDFTVLTGENGSGKTQLLTFIRDYSGGFYSDDFMSKPVQDQLENNSDNLRHPISSDDGSPLTEIVYYYPGLKNNDYEPQQSGQSLMNTIKGQWKDLHRVVHAYHSNRHLNFEDISKEQQELNVAQMRMVEAILPGQPSSSLSNIKQIQPHEMQQIKTIAAQCGKHPADLNFADFIIFYQAPLGLFSVALDLLFHQFHLKEKYYPHLTKNAPIPLEVFNEILERAHFKYKAEYAESNSEEVILPVKLVDRKSGKVVHFESLSSGETTIMALIFALYRSTNGGHFPQVILFDEPDAHLHPSLTQIFLDVIIDVLVKQHGVKVILTTHSPSTVALSPDDAIYCMDRDLGRPIKADRKAAVNILSNGLASITIEESSMGIVYNIKQTQKHVLFTEGITDKIILEEAWRKLYGDENAPFFIQECFGALF